MDVVQKQALKDLLHLLVDKEETVVLQDLISKLPAQYAALGAVILGALGPVAVTAEDKAVDSI